MSTIDELAAKSPAQKAFTSRCLPRGHVFLWNDSLGDYTCRHCMVVRALCEVRPIDRTIEP